MIQATLKKTALLLALLPLAGYAGKKTEKIGLAEKPVPVASVRNIQGFVGQRIALNRDVYLKNFPIDEYVDFVVRRQHRDWNWTRAEQHGKWLESAYLSAIQGGDQELLKKAQSELYRIIDSQEAEGYLGATARDYRSEERPIRGMDPYELYFVFHALTTVYEETGDKRALQSAERLADYMGRKVQLTLTPFCNIGQWYRKGEQKPRKNTKAFTYAIWLTGSPN